MFPLVKGVNRLKRPEPAPPSAEPPEGVRLLTEIRDLLRRSGATHIEARGADGSDGEEEAR